LGGYSTKTLEPLDKADKEGNNAVTFTHRVHKKRKNGLEIGMKQKGRGKTED
jgi:hypothetical protein